MTLDPSIQTALAHQQSGRFAEAEAIYRGILHQSPQNVNALVLLGILCSITNRPQAGIDLFSRAIQVRPDDARIHYNLGNVLCAEGRFDEALSGFDRAIQLKSDFVEAHINRGNALKELNRFDHAIADYRHAVGLDPRCVDARNNLGMALVELGQLDQAVAAIRQAIALNPASAAVHSNLLLTSHYLPDFAASVVADEHRRWNRQHAEPLGKFIAPHFNDRNPNRSLRIGYISADFRRHSIAYFFESLLASHDRQTVQTYCYSNVARADATTERLRQYAAHWREIRTLDDRAVADMIRQDQIDILVDLCGHTDGNRLLVLTRKPAPIQVTYLGYPDTAGMSSIDYRLTDGFADPPGQTEAFHSERLVRLPRTFLCYRPPDDAPPPSARAGQIVFGSFNALPKINAPLAKLWSRILHSAPDSRIVLKNRGLASPMARQLILNLFAAEGIDPDRIELHGPQPNELAHLQFYGQIDIALDTFPYHGTTTTCEALWMGVPTVTLAGRAHVSRVGVSILNNVGLPELVADSPEQYVRIATELARDASRRKDLRSNLRKRMSDSPLMDAPGFARDIEAAFRKMWQTWCATPEKS